MLSQGDENSEEFRREIDQAMRSLLVPGEGSSSLEQEQIIPVLEEILTAAADANKANADVERRLNHIIYVIRRWRLHIDDNITVELIDNIRRELVELAHVAEAKKQLHFAIEVLGSIGSNDKIHERVLSDIEKYSPAAGKLTAYNRRLLNVEKTKAFIFEIHAALQTTDQNRILLALHNLYSHIDSTLGEEYRHGKKLATAKDIRDTSSGDYIAILREAMSQEDGIKDLSIPNEKVFRAISDAIYAGLMQTAEPTSPGHWLHPLLLKLKLGSQGFKEVLQGRGTPERKIYDAEYVQVHDKYVARAFTQYSKDIVSLDFLKEFLVKNIRLQDIPAWIDRYFTGQNDTKTAFEKAFTDYMINHAYEIHQWQMTLLVGNTEQKIEARAEQILPAELAKIPANYRSYIAATEGEASALAYERYEKKNLLRIQAEKKFNADIKPAMISEAVDKSLAQAKKDVQVEIESASKVICEQYVKNIKNLIEATHGQWRVRLGGTTLNINGVEHKVPRNIAKIYAHCLQADIDKDWSKHFNDIAIIGCNASKPHRFDFFGATKRDEMTQEFYDNIKESFHRNSRLNRRSR